MDENVASNTEIGNCKIRLSAMCVEGGLENWWPIAYNGKKAGRIHLHGEWIASGSDTMSFSASSKPGLQQTVQQNTFSAAMTKGPRINTYQMPSYNNNEPSRTQPPQWVDRQYQDMSVVQQKGFMGQTRR